MIRTVPANTTRVSSTAFEVGRLIKAGDGMLVSLLATNKHTADLYLQIHERAVAATGGQAPIFTMVLPAGKTVGIDTPIKFSTGMWVGLSTAPGTYTAGGAHGWFLAQRL